MNEADGRCDPACAATLEPNVSVLWASHAVGADASAVRREAAGLLTRILPTSAPLLRHDSRGRPYLDGSDDLYVSFAYSAGVILVAVSRMAKVGVDIERRSDRGLRSLPAHALGDDESVALDRLPASARTKAFLTYWVRKEAILKAEGVGLGVEPSLIQVSAPTELAAVHSVPDSIGPASTWTLVDLDVPGCAAAVAVRRPAATVRLMRAENPT